MKVDEGNLRKSEESITNKWGKLWKTLGKVRKVKKIDEENLRRNEESYEDR